MTRAGRRAKTGGDAECGGSIEMMICLPWRERSAEGSGFWETGMPVAPGAVSSEDGSMGGDGCVRQVCAARALLALLGGLER